MVLTFSLDFEKMIQTNPPLYSPMPEELEQLEALVFLFIQNALLRLLIDN